MTPRLPPVEPPYDAEVGESLRRLMGPVEAPPLHLFRTIAHHPVMLDRFRQIGSSMLSFGLLPAADRELVIHRVTARCGAAYEWGVHAAVFAAQVGWDATVAPATWTGDLAAFDEHQALLLRAVDELHDDATWSEATWAGLRERYDDAELVELVCLNGFYHLVSYARRAFAVEPEEWAATPPG